MFKHIVVGCDGRPGGRDAVALGAQLASATGGRLSLVGVFPTWLVPVEGVTDRKTVRAQATQSLRRERDLLAPEAVLHTVAGSSVPRALRHYAERRRADLVIVGSSSAAAPGHVAISRRGRQLIYDVPFSLAVAACGFHGSESRLRAIAVGYDGGVEAQAALAQAAELARSAPARLLVRSVVEDQVPAFTMQEWMATTDFNHAHIWEHARQSALAEAETAASLLDVQAQVSASVGDPGYELRALSETMDLVVVGSRRWGPIARLVSGGVGETLVRDASCSILIVPRPRAAQRRHAGGRERRVRLPA